MLFVSIIDQQRNINQTSDPNQSAESQTENSPLQSDDPKPLADVTYSEIPVKKKKDKDDIATESNNVTKRKEKKSKSEDIDTAGPSDLVYAQIDIKDKKKTNGKGKSSESGDTFYSELKHNTDRGEGKYGLLTL
ncbi:basement membrane-specific heparan sulfate proteoglycan core [Labeo rohita]|uniref:Basement membrane-specific heparan sulfate proteoglycan core n=1 Tax=Labeo rohita TaxID=84645 RepID=A0A498NT61_LABRO|nr:basement membrane-specific heparan sulfate proteoglycan core [Labeo rohita]